MLPPFGVCGLKASSALAAGRTRPRLGPIRASKLRLSLAPKCLLTYIEEEAEDSPPPARAKALDVRGGLRYDLVARATWK